MIKSSILSLLIVLSLLVKQKGALLTFPPTAPTRTQLIVGIGIPFQTGEAISVISGWVLKSQHLLPINSTDLHPIFFDGIFGDNGIGPLFSFGRKRREIVTDNSTGQQYERYDGDVKVLEQKPDDDAAGDDDEFDDGGANYSYDEEEDLFQQFEDIASELNSPNRFVKKDVRAEMVPDTYDPSELRWMMYKNLESIVKNKGFEGKSCVLRAICEAAHSPFTHESGLFGELMNIVMTPSSSGEQLSAHSDNEYFRAEQKGRSGEPCDRVFKDCPESILEVFTDLYDPMEEFMEMMG